MNQENWPHFSSSYLYLALKCCYLILCLINKIPIGSLQSALCISSQNQLLATMLHIWNQLPTLATFKSKFKTVLFSCAFYWFIPLLHFYVLWERVLRHNSPITVLLVYICIVFYFILSQYTISSPWQVKNLPIFFFCISAKNMHNMETHFNN